ncbi:MAG: hypothetical protein ACT4N9_03005 [Paracoccaceae bacterium]
MIYTIAVHQDLIHAANHRAASLGSGPPDAQTFGAAVWHNAAGAAFAVACLAAPAGFGAALRLAVVRPAWDLDAIVDLEAASAAVDALDLPEAGAAAPLAAAGRIAVAQGLAPAEAIAAMGLSYPSEAI